MYGAAYPVHGVVALGPVFGPEVHGVTDRSSPDQPTMPDLDAEETVVALASLGLESAMALGETAGPWTGTCPTCSPGWTPSENASPSRALSLECRP
jgi:hypothetical protein